MDGSDVIFGRVFGDGCVIIEGIGELCGREQTCSCGGVGIECRIEGSCLIVGESFDLDLEDTVRIRDLIVEELGGFVEIEFVVFVEGVFGDLDALNPLCEGLCVVCGCFFFEDAEECALECGRRVEAIIGMFFKQTECDFLKENGDGLFFGDHGRGWFDLDGAERFNKGNAGIGGLSDTHLVEDSTEGKHFGGGAAFVGGDLFGGEVGGMSFE